MSSDAANSPWLFARPRAGAAAGAQGPETPAPIPGRFALVAVERGIERLRHQGPDATLAYRVTDEATAPGDRVRVPLGRGKSGRGVGVDVDGIVVAVGGPELLGDLDPARVRPIGRRVGPAFSPHLLALARWISDYYVCPLGMVFATMLPSSVKRGTGERSTRMLAPGPLASGDQAARAAARAALPRAAQAAWAALDELGLIARLPLPPAALTRLLAPRARAGPTTLRRLVDAGLLAHTRVTTLHAAPMPDGDEPDPDGNSPPDAPGGPGPAEPALAPAHVLTDAQHAAVEGLVATLGRFAPALLHGVTGSGKTEVYLRVIARVLERGGSAIVLVPEIALTPQTSRRFLDRFGAGRVAVLHSGLSAAQRHAQWALAASGAARVVVGARSAVFAPLADLGLIVVDEEHDHSYKQDQLPRYHARDVALRRGQLEACPVLLGSATPSLETWHNAAAHGPDAPARMALWSLPARVAGARLPAVRVVDLAHERRLRAAQTRGLDRHLHLIGPTLEAALDRTLATPGAQAMLLLNRRGYANYLCCVDPACGFVKQCDACDVTMVYHRPARAPAADGGRSAPGPGEGFIRCHHCLAEQRLPRTCPRCGKPVNTFGLGTQRVEEELERKFGHTRGLWSGRTLLRVDRDTMRTARDYFRALGRFARGQVRVLLGTQMIAKGLDFPAVRLVGVINADTSLFLPDFRAQERTFQLVSQVAGRAGRAAADPDGARPDALPPGEVIVQTMDPTTPAITLAAAHDFAGFAAHELAIRRRAGLPPLTRMARVVCRDEQIERATAAAHAVRAALDDEAGRRPPSPDGAPWPIRVRGPFPCPLSRIAGQFRVAVEVIAPTAGTLRALLSGLRQRGALRSDAHTAVDVDPLALL